MGPKIPLASVACAASVIGFPRTAPETTWCQSCGASSSGGPSGSTGTVWTTVVAGADLPFFADFFEDFFELFEVFELFFAPFFRAVFLLVSLAGAGEAALPGSGWAPAPKARQRLAATAAKSVRTCMRLSPRS